MCSLKTLTPAAHPLLRQGRSNSSSGGSMSSGHHEEAATIAAAEQAMQIAFLQDFYQVGGLVA